MGQMEHDSRAQNLSLYFFREHTGVKEVGRWVDDPFILNLTTNVLLNVCFVKCA